MSITSELFGDFTEGRLKRMRFVVFFIVIALVVMFFSAFFVFFALNVLNIDLLSLSELNKNILESIPAFTFMFFVLNLQAKRFRDMGLPGWLMALLYFASYLMAEFSDGYFALLLHGFTFILVLLLIFVPSDRFN